MHAPTFTHMHFSTVTHTQSASLACANHHQLCAPTLKALTLAHSHLAYPVKARLPEGSVVVFLAVLLLLLCKKYLGSLTSLVYTKDRIMDDYFTRKVISTRFHDNYVDILPHLIM